MATIQAKYSRGHKYWYIVESRRVNGKPRPIVLAYLGKAEDLLKRLEGLTESIRLKSYSHGGVAAMLQLGGNRLEIPSILNKYVESPRAYRAEQPVRNHLTAGITLLLAAIGRVCMPTSKRGWKEWAKTTSLSYLLRASLSKVDSQHFWDLMDAFPEKAIPKAEQEITSRVLAEFDISSDTLLYDTTNFFTFIDTANTRSEVAQRGHSKQKRHDLRQVGMALVVSREDMIPLFHQTYQGNLNDSKVFGDVLEKIHQRLAELNLDLSKHTLVFDRGNNSKKNLATVSELGMYYVGALTPYHHRKLLEQAREQFEPVKVGAKTLDIFRTRTEVWGEERTLIVFISDKLKTGQLRGIYQALTKAEKRLQTLQKSLANPKGRKRDLQKLEQKLLSITDKQFIRHIIRYRLNESSPGHFQLFFEISQQKISEIEDRLGFRILMTNRHHWSSKEIVEAYYGQSAVEHAFRDMKNPFHMAVRPQYHWTDQKIKVHFFICVIGYLLSSLIWRELRQKAGYRKSLGTLLQTLNNIRLATLLEYTGKKGRPKANYSVEIMTKEEEKIIETLQLTDYHNDRPKIKGVGVYGE